MRDLRHRRDWEALGAVDPYWAVLSDPTKRGGRWDRDEFFATGEAEVARLLDHAAGFGIPARLGRALDFGCGVGRLSRALASRFTSVVALDAARPMVDLARSACEGLGNVTIEVGGRERLAPMPGRSFDMVVSIWVLQHLPTEADIRATLGQLARLVGDDGLFAVQVPGRVPLRHRIQPRRRLFALLAAMGVPRGVLLARLGLSPIRMAGLRQVDARELLIREGLDILEVRADVIGGSSIDSFTYYATRRPTPRD